MPLSLPNLDTLRFADLVARGRATIPRYAPEWTDHNFHDPGITLIDLFAWLVEQVGYKANRVPERHRRKFLTLAGVDTRTACAAHVPLTFTLAADAAHLAFPAGTTLTGTASGRSLPFRTLTDLTVLPLAIQSVTVFDGRGYMDRTVNWRNRMPFAALGSNPSASAAAAQCPALLLALTAAPPSGCSLSLWLRFAGTDHDSVERQRLREASGTDNPPHHSAVTCWEYYDGTIWQAVQTSADRTRALTLDGAVTLVLPGAAAGTAAPSGLTACAFYLRCRLASGQLDAAPMLADIDVNTVEAEQSALPLTELDAAPTLDFSSVTPGSFLQRGLDLDATGRLIALTPGRQAPHPLLAYRPGLRPIAALIRLCQGDGMAGQCLKLPLDRATVAGAVELWTLSPAGWTLWSQQRDLDASTRVDAHFSIDVATDSVRFGDGEHGRVVRPEETVYGTYIATAGAAGNLPAGAAWRLGSAGNQLNRLLLGADTIRIRLLIENHAAATLGAHAEDLATAAGRAVTPLWAHEQLVEHLLPSGTLDGLDPEVVRGPAPPPQATTLADYERLALDLPGTRVARCRALVGAVPGPGTTSLRGVVVVIVPELPTGNPMPSVGFIDAVRHYLDLRRTVGTPISVQGPQYVTVDIAATVATKVGADPNRVQQDVAATLRVLFDPLQGGPDGYGWPFSRSVYRAEILRRIDDVTGVDYVTTLLLNGSAQADSITVGGTGATTLSLVAVGTIQVTAIRPA